MTDSPDYRLYLGKCIADLDKTVSDLKEDRKDMHEKLDKLITSISDQLVELKLIKSQTTLTNSRVSHLEEERDKYIATRVDQSMLSNVKAEIDSVSAKVEIIDRDLLEVWFFKKYPKVFIGILTAAVLATLGISYFNKRDMKEIRTKVNYIEAYEKIPFAPNRGAVMAYPDTAKIKK